MTATSPQTFASSANQILVLSVCTIIMGGISSYPAAALETKPSQPLYREYGTLHFNLRGAANTPSTLTPR
jgi:hypothetical protein